MSKKRDKPPPLNKEILEDLGVIVTRFFDLIKSENLPRLHDASSDLRNALIMRAMELCGGNMHEAARHLGMLRTTLSTIYSDINPNHRKIVRPGIIVSVNSLQEIPMYLMDEIKAVLKNYGY
jgi:DNA-binding protein Fis